ncbi:MAG: hypothetical protein UT30_C0008G0005 [Candidatus Uhrbacteria bacterium GW2011_GWF2_39_13]|uniref:Uncharacterized protein n=1 Tax=Candidatus Uhrbacteria bacterium GW2011_GWF2_39_13 TaxID=1618995 RepID=A0A0G0MMN7_9BACT|nr:MAG: hypothetical protein UT30_C0008G0005 [Candidatus Uhrbacteria bacterium GW2011_GWF2_39_13]
MSRRYKNKDALTAILERRKNVKMKENIGEACGLFLYFRICQEFYLITE